MSTHYYAIALEEVVQTGVQYLHFQSVGDTATHLLKRLQEGANHLNQHCSEDNSSSEIEIGAYSNDRFHPTDRNTFREVLTGDYIIFNEHRQIYTPAKFIEQLRKWQFDVDSWLAKLPE